MAGTTGVLSRFLYPRLVQILDLTEPAGRAVSDFDSLGFTIASLGTLSPGQIATARLDAGGRIGRHEAIGAQVLVCLSGDAVVSGADGHESAIGPGRAAAWAAGESHETRTTTGLLTLIIEGDWTRGPA